MGLRQNLSKLMRDRGENSNSLSKKTKVTQSTIFRLLNGHHHSPTRETVAKLARFFGVTVEALYSEGLSETEDQAIVRRLASVLEDGRLAPGSKQAIVALIEAAEMFPPPIDDCKVAKTIRPAPALPRVKKTEDDGDLV